MPKLKISIAAPVTESFRVSAVRGRFDLPDKSSIEKKWDVDMPIEAKPW